MIIPDSLRVCIKAFGLCLFLSLANVGLHAQPQLTTQDKRAAKLYREAVEYYGQKKYVPAETALKSAVQRDNNFVEAWLLMGDLYLDARDQAAAIQAYEEAIRINPSFFPKAILVVANLYRIDGSYQLASERYQQFLQGENIRLADRHSAETGLASSVFAINALANPVPFDPHNLGGDVNGPYDEFVNALSTDRSLLLFTRKHPSSLRYQDGRPVLVEDFFLADWKDGSFVRTRPLGPPINTDGNEGALTISADNRYLFFSGCNRRDGVGSCDLYYSIREGEGWRAPRNPGPPLNSSRWDSHPSFSADNRSLFFASARSGSKGKSDIWMAVVGEDGRWLDPVNLGDSINTAGQEVSPLIHPDGQTLYFASDGHPGMGGLDLFLSRKGPDGKWGKPLNLGYPINTLADELALVVDVNGEWAYFSSDKLGGYGGYDMYRFILQDDYRPVPVTYVKGKVFDAETFQALQSRFELVDLATGTTIVSAGSDPLTGEFLVCIPSGKSYGLNASSLGYLFYSEHFYVEKTTDILDPFLKDIPMHSIKEGHEVVMRNVFFETASFALLPESKIELDRLVKLLNENPGMQIEIAGHTDNIGTAAYNQVLSENRAAAVVNFLIEKGIDKQRLRSAGYGLTQPIASNETEEGRALNRRTTFTVTGTSR